MYGFLEVQTALSKLHGCYPNHVGALRGRLQHFQKLGMSPSSPGRGKVIQYEFPDVARWAFGLELVEIGVDPARVAKVVPWLWLEVGPVLCEDHVGEKVFAAFPTMMITALAEQQGIGARGPGGLSCINVTDRKPRFVFDVEEFPNWRPGRAITVNLSELRGRLVGYLAESQDEAEITEPQRTKR